LVVTGALPGPARQLLGGGKDRHLDPDLGDDRLRGAPLNPGDTAQKLNGRLERGDLLSDRLGEAGDLLIEKVDVGKDRPDPDRVQVIEIALQHLFERRELGPQATLGELG
jgi:hypothetical protein